MKRVDPERRLEAVPERPEPPDHLSARAQTFWIGVAETWALGPDHLEILRRACEVLDRLDAAEALVRRDGLVVTGSKGQPIAHPAVAIERDCRTGFARLMRQLNLEGEPPAQGIYRGGRRNSR